MRVIGTLRPGLADVVTIGNALCGSAAMLFVIATLPSADPVSEIDVLRVVALLILSGLVCDVFDGAVARARGGTPLGPYLDSLADAVTFGVAPAVALGGIVMRHATTVEAIVIAAGAAVYVAGALVRLADFDAGRAREPDFTGMPSPLAAVVALSIGFLGLAPLLSGAALAVIGWLMVSGIRYPRTRGIGHLAKAASVAVGLAGVTGLLDVQVVAALTVVGLVFIAPMICAVDRQLQARRAILSESGTGD